VVEQVTTSQTPTLMYNLTVAGAHNFFVGDEKWLVHNASCSWLGSNELSNDPIGKSLADEADKYWKSVNGNKVVGVAQANNSRYVTVNNGASQDIKNMVKKIATGRGDIFITPSGESFAGHAERILYRELNAYPDLKIGVSHPYGPCTGFPDSCTNFFREIQFYNIFWNKK
jgi:hypothetical protein